jgi:hypothetical protein
MSLSTLQVDDTVFRDRLNALAMHVGDAGKVLKQEAKMLIREIVSKTPPKTAQQGRNKLESDLLKVFFPIEAEDFKNAKRDLKNASGFVKLWVTRGGFVFYVEQNKFLPDASLDQLRAIHERHRGRKGRVVSVSGRTGNQKFTKRNDKEVYLNRYVVKGSVFRRYLRERSQKVGTMKSGWGQAANLLSVPLPAYVTRQIKPSHGRVIDDLSDKTSPSVTIINSTPGIAEEMGWVVERALNSRALSMAQNLKRLIKYGPGKNGNSGYAS